MSSNRVGWEGWAIAIIALGGVPAGLLFLPMVHGFDGASPVRYVPPPPASPPLDPSRLALGIGLALFLIAAAVWLIRHTDWDTTAQSDDR